MLASNLEGAVQVAKDAGWWDGQHQQEGSVPDACLPGGSDFYVEAICEPLHELDQEDLFL